jgi:hypothetical protein
MEYWTKAKVSAVIFFSLEKREIMFVLSYLYKGLMNMARQIDRKTARKSDRETDRLVVNRQAYRETDRLAVNRQADRMTGRYTETRKLGN